MKTTSEELTVFVQVVENGSFSRAAKQLAIANSAVSRVVKRLEEKLGVNLINRTTRQLRLTEEGSPTCVFRLFSRRAEGIIKIHKHQILKSICKNTLKPDRTSFD